MNEIVQWSVVAAAVAGAAAFLARRLTRPRGGCCDRCASCPSEAKLLVECPDPDGSSGDCARQSSPGGGHCGHP